MNQVHLTEEEIQLIAGGDAGADTGSHAAECEFCRTRILAARALDRSLRRIPLEPASPALAASVLQELGIVRRNRSPFWFVESIAAFAGLCLVLGGLIAVVYLTGWVGGGESPSLSVAGESLNQIRGEVTGAASSALGWLGKSMQIISASSGVEMTLLMVLVVGGLGLLDRVLFRPLRHAGRR